MSFRYVRVGELACQKNSYLTELTATVVSCEPQKPTKQKSKASAASSSPLFDIVLSDSVLFPEGGGQPCDYGVLTALTEGRPTTDNKEEEGDGVEIRNVQRHGDMCVMTSPTAFAVGATVHQALDWGRRLDHMQHHTGQHLLSAVLEREDVMALHTASWSLTHPYCFIQLDLTDILSAAGGVGEAAVCPSYAKHLTKDKRLTEDIIGIVEAMCNEAILAATPVACAVFDSKEAYAEATAVAQQNAADADADADAGGSGVVRSRGIPDDVTGPIRVIQVGDVDSCTCCGTHIRNLSELRALHLLHQEVKGNMLKLYFITGERALTLFGSQFERERALITALGGCRPEDFVTTVQRRAKDAADYEKKIKKWACELAAVEADRILVHLSSQDLKREEGANNNNNGGVAVVCVRRDDVDVDFFQAIRNILDSNGRSATVLVAAWATSNSNNHASNATDVQGQLLITSTSSEDLGRVSALAVQLMSGIKGGTSKMGFRGKGSLQKWGVLVDALQGYSS